MGGAVRLDGLQEAAATVDAAALDDVRFGFDRAHPHRSARRVVYFTQAFALAAVVGGLAWALIAAPAIAFTALHLCALALFACAILWRLIAASNLTPLLWRLADPVHFPTYSILCPLYREANVVSDLVAALSQIDWPGKA